MKSLWATATATVFHLAMSVALAKAEAADTPIFTFLIVWCGLWGLIGIAVLCTKYLQGNQYQ